LCSYLKTRLFVKASVDLDAEVRSMYPEHDPSTANFCEYSLPVVGSCPTDFDKLKYVANLSLLDESHYTKFNFKNLEEHIFELLSNERKAIYKATLDACPEDACAEARIKAFQSKSVVTPFSKAFNTFFKTGGSKLVFSKVDEKNSLLFRKGDANFKIQKLSSGEKRIVQLGAMLLTCKTIKDGGVVLVDEPELSMHPRWQQGILKYYRDLLPDNVQLFVATHSEKVVEAALKDDDALVVLLQEKDGKIVPQYIAKDGSEIKKWGNNSKDDGKFVLPRITSAEVNYEIFGIQSVDYFMQLYGMLAGDNSIHEADKKIKEYLKKHPEEYPPEPKELGTPNYWYRVNPQYHERKDPYETLPTYIRNYLSHPTSKRPFDTNPDEENGGFDGAIEKSTGLLREILLHLNKSDEHEISALAQKCA
ncbi:MAG: AAA family ATPase, partial [Alphaproteobacteria bacterium]|nr:AAA family ATPase [Alphaproteobacteria bacterium]